MLFPRTPGPTMTDQDHKCLRVNQRGYAVITNPLLNRDDAFTLEERAKLGISGLIPPAVNTLEQQAKRAWGQVRENVCPFNVARPPCPPTHTHTHFTAHTFLISLVLAGMPSW
jgi:hypothetical protein